jgi:hypothetical protein
MRKIDCILNLAIIFIFVGIVCRPIEKPEIKSVATSTEVATQIVEQPTVPPPTEVISVNPFGFTKDQVSTLGSLEVVDGYPLYVMHYSGDYTRYSFEENWDLMVNQKLPTRNSSWACSLFAALGDETSMVYGRNFDWQYSPALLLFISPSDGYASVSMVDIAYLGYDGVAALDLQNKSMDELVGLLDAPYLPFDGLNEMGVAIGMAAVPPGGVEPDSNKETIGSIGVIREILDHAADVGEAVDILESFNIDFGGGPDIHYLIADSYGKSALVEHHSGEVKVIYNFDPWHLATNFLRSSQGVSATGICGRYDEIKSRLSNSGGTIGIDDALRLLEDVSQENTQWSIVYSLTTGEINVSMDRNYQSVHEFHLDMIDH